MSQSVKKTKIANRYSHINQPIKQINKQRKLFVWYFRKLETDKYFGGTNLTLGQERLGELNWQRYCLPVPSKNILT